MDRNFSRALDAVLQYEGGYSNNPKDPGGPTNLGVTLENFRKFVNPTGTIDDLKALTREQAGVVYRRHYWDVVMGSSLPDGVDLAVFDFAVNSGPSRAIKALQSSVGVAVDGAIGPQTLAATANVDKVDVINMICDKRLAFLQGLPTFKTFGNGWTSRVQKVRALARELAAQPADAPPVIVKRDNPAPLAVKEPVAVVAKGSDKRNWLAWPLSGISLTTVFTSFADLPWQYKVASGIVVLALVALMYFLGDRIIRRVKSLRDEINAA